MRVQYKFILGYNAWEAPSDSRVGRYIKSMIIIIIIIIIIIATAVISYQCTSTMQDINKIDCLTLVNFTGYLLEFTLKTLCLKRTECPKNETRKAPSFSSA